MRSKLFIFIGLLAVVSIVMASCAPPAAPAEPETIVVIETVVVEGEVIEKEVVITTTPAPVVEEEAAPMMKRLVTTNGGYGDIPTLDPQKSTDSASNALINVMYIGLTRLHETKAIVEPGMATSWDISEDGLTYTFHLRTDIPWVHYTDEGVVEVLDDEGNVRYVTAGDFAHGITRECDPEVAADYAYVFYIVDGCEAFNSGEGAAEDVMAVPVDDGTLEVTFNTNAVYVTNIIGMWIGVAAPQWAIEANGDRWTEPGFNQSYGPYALKEWVHDSYATIVRNPFWPEDMETVPRAKIDEIDFMFLDAVPAFAEYEAGSMDASQVPLADMDRVKADPVLSEELFIGPQFCTYYYGFNTQAEHVDDVRVRQALSMAVDRQSLVDNVTKGGQIPAGWFSRPGLTGAPTTEKYPDNGIWYNPDEAKKLFDDYLAEMELTAADLDLTLMFNTSSGHQAIAEAIQQMWKDTLGVEVKLTNQEWQVYLDTVRSANTPDIWRLGWCLDYPDANNFINEVFGAGGLGNPAKPDGVGGGINWYEGEEYEAWYQLLLDAAVEPDPDVRQDMYAEAEQILSVDKAAMIPLYWYTTVSVTKPYVERTFAVTNAQAYEKWDINMGSKYDQ
jgi:oligopeptide transport system substrate-binding protein